MTAATTRRQEPDPLMDVDQVTGRLLSVNELRRALQLARQAATAPMPSTSAVDADPGPTTAASDSPARQFPSGAANSTDLTVAIPDPAAPPPPAGGNFLARTGTVGAPWATGSSTAESGGPALFKPSAASARGALRFDDPVPPGVNTGGGWPDAVRTPVRQRASGEAIDDRTSPVDDLFDDLDVDSADADLPEASVKAEPGGPGPASRSLRFVRTFVGFTRPDSKPRRRRRHRKGSRHDAGWLAGLDDDADNIVEDPPAGVSQQRSATTSAATPAGRAIPRRVATDDLVLTAAPRGFAAVMWLWVARLAVMVILLAGVNQVFVKPFQKVTPAAAAVTLNVAASQQAAARYVSDYLTFRPGRGPAQLAALQGEVAGAVGAARMQWSGTGYLRADSVLPGQVVPIDPGHSLVSVAALIHTAMPPSAQRRIDAPPGPSAVAVAMGPVPTGWTDLGSRWVQLTVPVQSTGAEVRVSGTGPVFAGEAPQLIAESAGAQVDEGITAATAGAGRSLLTGYAASNLSYLTAPGASLSGLHGAVTLLSVTGWSVSLLAGSTTGVATASVTWQLAGTDLTVSQPYAVELTHSLDRWYGAGLGVDTATR